MLLPDKRIELAERKKKKQNEEQVSDEDEEEEEEDNAAHGEIADSHEDENEYDENEELNDDNIQNNGDFGRIRAEDVRDKLNELTEEASQNHNILILQNIKLQEMVKQE